MREFWRCAETHEANYCSPINSYDVYIVATLGAPGGSPPAFGLRFPWTRTCSSAWLFLYWLSPGATSVPALLRITLCEGVRGVVNLRVDCDTDADCAQANLVNYILNHNAPNHGGVTFFFTARAGTASSIVSIVEVCQRFKHALGVRTGLVNLGSFFGNAFVVGEEPGEAEVRLSYAVHKARAPPSAATPAAAAQCAAGYRGDFDPPRELMVKAS